MTSLPEAEAAGVQGCDWRLACLSSEHLVGGQSCDPPGGHVSASPPGNLGWNLFPKSVSRIPFSFLAPATAYYIFMLLNLCLSQLYQWHNHQGKLIQPWFFSVSHPHSQSIGKSSLLFLQNTFRTSLLSGLLLLQSHCSPNHHHSCFGYRNSLLSLSLLTLTTFPR